MTERKGATVTRTLSVGEEAVATVLADPRAYDGVVVGSRRIRWFDPSWPAPGARFHHTLGFGPVTIRDHSEVLVGDLPSRLRLLVRLRPVGSAEVEFRLTGEGDRTHVAMTETPVSGALALAWSPPLAAATRWRNERVLARLEEVAQGRARSMARAAGRRDTDAEAPRPGRQAKVADAGRDADEAGDG